MGDKGVLDVTKLGLSELSMRVRVGRNLTQFNLPGAMDKSERIEFEKAMLKAFDKLKKDPAYGGTVYSLSPVFARRPLVLRDVTRRSSRVSRRRLDAGAMAWKPGRHRRDAIDASLPTQDFGDGEKNPNLITPEKYAELVKKHVMFKHMAADTYLASAGIADDWPYGRGCWQSDDKQCIVWFGEEDQLRIMCMKRGTKLNEVFDRLKKMLDTIESIDGIDFATPDAASFIFSS